MFKNLNPALLGITGRQSEIIELALTHGFRGLDVELYDLEKHTKHPGADSTIRLLTSARLRIGAVELPVRWRGTEDAFQADLKGLDELAAFAANAKVSACTTQVLPGSDDLPYHENFEMHRTRLAQIADALAKHNIRLAIGFQAAAARRTSRHFQFIQEANSLAMLLKSVGSPNAGLWLDTWDWNVGGGTADTLRALGIGRVAYVTVADVPADADRSNLSEERRLLPAEDGTAQLPEIFAALRQAGYQGPITLAPHPSCFSGARREAIAQKCSAALDQLLKGADSGVKLAPAGK